MKGSDADRFLQGLWTCDITRARHAAREHGRAVVVSGYLLNLKGRALAPGVMLVPPEGPVRVNVPLSSGEAAREAMDRLLVADDVELSAVKPLSVWAGWDDTLPEAMPLPHPVPGALDAAYLASDQPWGVLVPRGELGSHHHELWIHDGATPPPHRELADDAYAEARVRSGTPEWGVDYDAETLILEMPIAKTISFHKGCYVGQEVVARATYRGHRNRGLCRFESTGASLAPGFVYADDPAQPVGRLTTVAGGGALGLLRLTALEAGGLKDAAGTSIARTEAL